MGQDRTLARGARVFGSLLLAALALLSLVWIVRDFTKAGEVVDVWWNWTGLVARAEDGVWVTSFLEPMLLLLYAVTAVTAYRSSSSAAILACTGVLTVVVRAPGLWNLGADWMQGVPDGLLSQVLFSTIAAVIIGVVLVVTAVSGRRPAQLADPSAFGYGFPSDTAPPSPAGPTKGGAVAAFLLLGSSGAIMAAWEIRGMQQLGWDRYERLLTGERAIVRLLDSPVSWMQWAVIVLALVAGIAALSGAPFSRPLGLIMTAPLLAFGVFAIAYGVKTDLFEHFGDLGIEAQLHVLTSLFQVVAGAAVLLALARGEQHAPRPLPQYHAGGSAAFGPPPQAW
ncbi:hypothetical protein [Streptomyces albus]|uniref:hypothetical protein n=1 Tax=Streptomyces albus TaxID=1888 RepID=UPI003F1A6C58